MTRLCWLSILLMGSLISVWAQQAPQPAQEPDQSQSPSPQRTLIPRSRQQREDAYRAAHHIILNVQVSDASGKAAHGLTRDDFTLFDNGPPKSAVSFESVESGEAVTAVRVVLMLDTVNNSSLVVTHARKEIERFISFNQGRLTYPTAIGHLSPSGAGIGKFTQDGNMLSEGLRNALKDNHTVSCTEEVSAASQEGLGGQASAVTPEGTDAIQRENLLNRLGNCENRRFRLSISELNKLAKEQAGMPGRTLVIWIGPGWPLLTGPEFRPNTVAMRRSFYDYLADLSNSIREANLTLDAIASPEMVRGAGIRMEDVGTYMNARPQDDQADAGNLSLPVLAKQSGGRILEQSKDLAGAIDLCVADAASYYILSFDSAAAARPGEYRALEVRVSQPGLTVRTTTGYFAQP